MENDSVAFGWDLLIKRLRSMRNIEGTADGVLSTDSKRSGSHPSGHQIHDRKTAGVGMITLGIPAKASDAIPRPAPSD